MNNYMKPILSALRHWTQREIKTALEPVESAMSDKAGVGYVDSVVAEGVGSCVPVPSTAKVGQTITVKAVDEDGVPTEWEAVDVVSGGSEYPKSVLLSDFVVEEDVNGSICIPLQDNPFNYSSLLITITAQLLDGGEQQYCGRISDGEKMCDVFHLNTKLSTTKKTTFFVLTHIFKDMVFSIAVKKVDYMWNSSQSLGFQYPFTKTSREGNALTIYLCSALAGATIKVQGVR